MTLGRVCESRYHSWWQHCQHIAISRFYQLLLPASPLQSNSIQFNSKCIGLHFVLCSTKKVGQSCSGTRFNIRLCVQARYGVILRCVARCNQLAGCCYQEQGQLITARQRTACCQRSPTHSFISGVVSRSLTAGLSAVPCHVFYCVMIKVEVSYASHRDNALPVPVYQCIFNTTPYAL